MPQDASARILNISYFHPCYSEMIVTVPTFHYNSDRSDRINGLTAYEMGLLERSVKGKLPPSPDAGDGWV